VSVVTISSKWQVVPLEELEGFLKGLVPDFERELEGL